MRVLTLEHPWPLAIFLLGKSIENRTWHPGEKHIGTRILIHGGAMQILKDGSPSNSRKGRAFQVAAHELNDLISEGTLDGSRLGAHWRSLPEVNESIATEGSVPWSAWCMPGLAGVVTLQAVRENVKDLWAIDDGKQKHWVLTDKVMFREPIPMPADDKTFRLGLWQLPEELLPDVHAAIQTGIRCP